MRPRLVTFVSRGLTFLVIVAFTTNQAFAQCALQTWAQLPTPAAQPGLTTFQGKLWVGWVGLDGAIYVSSSYDGWSWEGAHMVYAGPGVSGYDGGVGMTFSDFCGQVYIGWRGPNYKMYAARSYDGYNWSTTIIGDWGQSAPALIGDDPNLPVGWAYSAWWPNTNDYQILTGKTDCDLNNSVFIDCLLGCFPNEGGWEPGLTPVWTGANGVQLKILEYGHNASRPGDEADTHWWMNSAGGGVIIPQQWSNNGMAGAVDPNTGKAYFSWTCHNGGSDTCSSDSGDNNKIKFMDLPTTTQFQVCSDWSRYNPALTFFNGLLFFAWKGGGNGLFVSSIQPF